MQNLYTRPGYDVYMIIYENGAILYMIVKGLEATYWGGGGSTGLFNHVNTTCLKL